VRIAGAGAMGVAAAQELAARGYDVTITDPGPLPRPEAASTDISKIVRMDYGADVLYTEMMEGAIPRWRAWSARWGGGLFHEDGFLLLSRAKLTEGTFEGDSLRTLERRGHRVERLDAEAIARRFPAWTGYVDGYRKFHGDEGFTFTTWDPHVRLDYAFLPEPFKGRLQRCEVIRDHPAVKQASDHFPLVCEIAL